MLSTWGWVLSTWGWVLSTWGWVLSTWGWVQTLSRPIASLTLQNVGVALHNVGVALLISLKIIYIHNITSLIFLEGGFSRQHRNLHHSPHTQGLTQYLWEAVEHTIGPSLLTGQGKLVTHFPCNSVHLSQLLCSEGHGQLHIAILQA